MQPLSFGQRFNEGAKKVIAGGIPALFVDAPAPDTYGEAFKQAIPNRMKSVSEQFAMPDVTKDETGKMSVDPESIKRLSDAAISMAPVGSVKNVASPLTTKILKQLEGKMTVSKQYISDLTNSGELKQQERDLIRKVLQSENANTVHVPSFAEKVKDELLPLERTSRDRLKTYVTKENFRDATRYEGITLPGSIRGKVANYSEQIYQSPIKTSAGETHFSGKTGSDKYFGHTRVEDMADNQTRRVIEVQSDLYQKGRLAEEKQFNTFEEALEEARSRGSIDDEVASQKLAKQWWDEEKGLSKLEQYSNPTAHFRMVREEIKKAAEDGKTKLQFPTGETAMKIEGLGVNSAEGWRWSDVARQEDEFVREIPKNAVGKTVWNARTGDEWVITDILGDGKFKAVPKTTWDEINSGSGSYHKSKVSNMLQRESETFDISGKPDPNNPIYRFYEKEVGRYLTNKYGAKTVVDNKGVSWYEVPIDKQKHSLPVEAFAATPIALSGMIKKAKDLFSSTPQVYERDKSKDDIPKVKSTHKDLYGTVHTLDVPLKVNEKDPSKTTFLTVREPTKRMQETISAVYHKNPEVPRGLLESILMQESSMGASTTNKNKSIGEFAYLVGFTPVAKQELIRNGIIPDLNTPAGVLQAVADYYKLKKDIRDAQGNVIHTYDNMAKWYAERFSSGKLPPEVIQQFDTIYKYYANK